LLIPSARNVIFLKSYERPEPSELALTELCSLLHSLELGGGGENWKIWQHFDIPYVSIVMILSEAMRMSSIPSRERHLVFSITSRQAPGSNPLPIQHQTWTSSLGLKRPGSDASAEENNGKAILSLHVLVVHSFRN
jgi:hypothetical protein